MNNIKLQPIPHVKSVSSKGVECDDGSFFPADVTVWASGAEPQPVNIHSDFKLCPRNYMLVNDHLQSVSHPNLFGGGDCISIERYLNEEHIFPPKAGVYAVREGPIIANNIIKMLKGEELETYTPQREFLALLCTGDQMGLGNKFGITFSGKWVWNMKDFIDTTFMKLFTPKYLFEDYETQGYAKPIEHNELFEDESAEVKAKTQPIRDSVAKLNSSQAAQILSCGEEEEEFFERLFILDRMHFDPDFASAVVSKFRPPY